VPSHPERVRKNYKTPFNLVKEDMKKAMNKFQGLGSLTGLLNSYEFTRQEAEYLIEIIRTKQRK